MTKFFSKTVFILFFFVFWKTEASNILKRSTKENTYLFDFNKGRFDHYYFVKDQSATNILLKLSVEKDLPFLNLYLPENSLLLVNNKLVYKTGSKPKRISIYYQRYIPHSELNVNVLIKSAHISIPWNTFSVSNRASLVSYIQFPSNEKPSFDNSKALFFISISIICFIICRNIEREFFLKVFSYFFITNNQFLFNPFDISKSSLRFIVISTISIVFSLVSILFLPSIGLVVSGSSVNQLYQTIGLSVKFSNWHLFLIPLVYFFYTLFLVTIFDFWKVIVLIFSQDFRLMYGIVLVFNIAVLVSNFNSGAAQIVQVIFLVLVSFLYFIKTISQSLIIKNSIRVSGTYLFSYICISNLFPVLFLIKFFEADFIR